MHLCPLSLTCQYFNFLFIALIVRVCICVLELFCRVCMYSMGMLYVFCCFGVINDNNTMVAMTLSSCCVIIVCSTCVTDSRLFADTNQRVVYMRQHQRDGRTGVHVRTQSVHRSVSAAQERAARCDQDQRPCRWRKVHLRPSEHRTQLTRRSLS